MTAHDVQKEYSSSVLAFPYRTSHLSFGASSQIEPTLAQVIPFPALNQSAGVSAPSERLKDKLAELANDLGHQLAGLLSIALLDAAAEVLTRHAEAARGHHVASDVNAASLRRHQDPSAARNTLQRELQARFEAEPVEDGVTHSAERSVIEALRNYPEAKKWLWQLMSDPQCRYRIDLLRCVGRMPSDLVGDWGIWVASQMLQSEDIEVRDAAICALELWGTHEAAEALKAHRESVPWLADYVASVLKSL